MSSPFRRAVTASRLPESYPSTGLPDHVFCRKYWPEMGPNGANKSWQAAIQWIGGTDTALRSAFVWSNITAIVKQEWCDLRC
jgi:hypothetical protein